MTKASSEPRPRAHRTIAPLAALLALIAACATEDRPAVGQRDDALTRTTTIRRGTFGAVADTYVSAAAMRRNFGDQKKLLVSARNEALLRFDLSSIPANAVIDQATLTLTFNGGDDEDDDDCDDGDHEGHHIAPIKVRRVTAPWTEGTVTYRSFDQQFAPEVVGRLILGNRSSTKSVDLRALVQGWVAGTVPNHGIVLTTAGRQHTLIVASEQARVARRPALEIRYTTPDDHCAAAPCAHGTCTNQAGGFTCTCDPGWTGATCSQDLDDCASAPCGDHGVCTDALGGYTCACLPGFTGDHCETDVDDCAGAPCANGGVCTDGVADFTCACPPGWGGDTCADDLDECADQPCGNGGACTDAVNGFTCACPAGFTGDRCETNVDDCAGVTCQHGGTCADGIDRFTCECAAGYGGTFCEDDLDDCLGNACGHGTCVDQVAGYTCTCDPGFTGELCDVDVDDCAGEPCANDGTCVDLIDGFACECRPGYGGATCETSEGVTQLALAVPAIAYVGDTIAIPVALTRTTAPLGPVGAAPVTVTLTGPEGATATTTTVTVTTDPAGNALATFAPVARGRFAIAASYDGSPALAPSAAAGEVPVYQRARLAVSLTSVAIAGQNRHTCAGLLTTTPGDVGLTGQPIHILGEFFTPVGTSAVYDSAASPAMSGSGATLVRAPTSGGVTAAGNINVIWQAEPDLQVRCTMATIRTDDYLADEVGVVRPIVGTAAFP